MHFQSRRIGEAVEEDVVAHEKVDGGDFPDGRNGIVVVQYPLDDAWQHFDAAFPIVEFYYSHHVIVLSFVHELLTLLCRAFEGDGDVSPELLVDGVHYFDEDWPMR